MWSTQRHLAPSPLCQLLLMLLLSFQLQTPLGKVPASLPEVTTKHIPSCDASLTTGICCQVDKLPRRCHQSAPWDFFLDHSNKNCSAFFEQCLCWPEAWGLEWMAAAIWLQQENPAWGWNCQKEWPSRGDIIRRKTEHQITSWASGSNHT